MTDQNSTAAQPETFVGKVEDEIETVAADVVRWFRHVETGVVGFFHGAGKNTDGDHVTTVITSTGPFTAPTPSFVGIAAPIDPAIAATDTTEAKSLLAQGDPAS